VLNLRKDSFIKPESKPVELMAWSFEIVIPQIVEEHMLWPSTTFQSYSYYREAYTMLINLQHVVPEGSGSR